MFVFQQVVLEKGSLYQVLKLWVDFGWVEYLSFMAQDSSSKVPIFDGSDYVFWEVMMQTYLLSINFDVWASVVNGYKVPNTLPIDLDEKRKYETDMKAKFSILNILSKDVLLR